MVANGKVLGCEKGAIKPLPYAPRIQTVSDIRNHQGDTEELLSKEDFDKLLVDIKRTYNSRRGFGKRIKNTIQNVVSVGFSNSAVVDLYVVYTLLFDTTQNDFWLGLADEQKEALGKRLRKVKREYKAMVPIATWKQLRNQ